MQQRSKQRTIELELRFDAAATPARVAATAQFIDRVLSAADPQLPADSVTLVVSNRTTVASLRGWTPAGSAVLHRCERFFRSPAREVSRDPNVRRLAAAVAEAASDIVPFHARVAKPRASKPLATINERFVESLARLAAPPAAAGGLELPVAGSTEIYSPIYRVGRLDEGKEMRARIRIEDRPYDVPIEPDAIAAAFDVAKAGAVVPIQIVGGWSRSPSDGLVLDAARARIVRIGAGWRPITGPSSSTRSTRPCPRRLLTLPTCCQGPALTVSIPMVDTNVVIYAMRRQRPEDPPDLTEMLAASDALLRGLPAIRVSAVTVVEVMRGLRPEERERDDVKARFARFQVEAIDGAAADLAVKLLRQKNANEKVCPRCVGSERSHKCPACGRVASSQQRVNDALIAATAETRAGVPVL